MGIEKVKSREAFRSKTGFIIACIGSSVGMGNIWMFPSRVSKYGGGAFLILYLLAVAVLGFSGVIGEMAFGRAAKSGPMKAFEKACESHGNYGKVGRSFGLIPVLGAFALAVGYAVVVGWICRYAMLSYSGNLLKPNGVEQMAEQFASVSGNFSNNLWVFIGIAITLVIMSAGVAKGIELANKIMMPLFFVLFAGLAIYIMTLPGALEGYRYLFTIDKEQFLNPKTWIFALGQAFFSLSLAGSGTIIYGSYLSDEEDILSAAWKVALFDTLAALLAAMVILPAMAAAGQQLSSSGPGLMFIYLPNLFQGMRRGRWIAIFFFTAVFFAGVSSLLNLLEVPIATMQDRLKLSRKKAVLFVGGAGLILSLCIQGIISQWMDVVSIYICPIGAILAGIMFYWVWGSKFAREQLQKGRKKKIGKWLEPVTKYVFCGITILVFVLCCLIPGGI